MPTIAAGSVATVYCPLAGSITITPGSAGAASFQARGNNGGQSSAPRVIYAAESVAVAAGDTVSIQAITSDATYTTPAGGDTALQALVSDAGKSISVACGLLGQSLPFGAVLANDSLGAANKVYFSAPNQNYYEPDPYAPGAAGGYFTPALQQLGAEGIKVFFTNTALGGVSMINDFCGVLNTGGWAANRAYRGRRTTLGTGDPGTKGDFIVEGGRVWECTTGNNHLALLNSDTAVTVGGTAWRKNVTSIAKDTARTSANAKPTFSGAAVVNDTVTDNGTGATGGGLVWTCVQVGGTLTADASSLRVGRSSELYWDPYFMLTRARTAVAAQPVAANNKYMIVVGTVQSDSQANQLLIRLAHQLICTYMAAESVKTIHTSCLFYPSLANADYDSYETVLSGAGLDSPEDYANSLLTVALTGSGYTRGNPGVTGRSGAIYYYMKSLYRHFGTDVLSMLQTPQPNPHVTAAGAILCANAHVPALRAIFRNEPQV